jgi:hypothetical protein
MPSSSPQPAPKCSVDWAINNSSAQIALANTMNSPARAKITRSTGLAAMYLPPARIASPTGSR